MKRLNRVYLIRHGQVVGYENFTVYGHTDVDLTETGILQMKQVAERLRLIEISAIYSSDLKRSALSARQIARYHDVQLSSLQELREMYFGDWEGMTMKDIRKDFPEELKKRQEDLVSFKGPGDGESVRDFSVRITNCFERILSEQQGKDIVIVAHGAVNRIILCSALGLDQARMFNIQQDYGCLNIIDYFPDSTLVRLVNG
ncbi:MAG: alpha-ribazole phosphatase [Deltaproteobacteria bacterium]|nr:alpha-ribazole phosphatase [Deltaproteobacteria bacterium]MBW2117786.1 alpha-ribazole phosphatase [Deltaproteobacteria bacterium]MBW2343753.1 alpha-ribazole phosphatase [Deltaproteobacteria bacterium]